MLITAGAGVVVGVGAGAAGAPAGAHHSHRIKGGRLPAARCSVRETLRRTITEKNDGRKVLKITL